MRQHGASALHYNPDTVSNSSTHNRLSTSKTRSSVVYIFIIHKQTGSSTNKYRGINLIKPQNTVKF
jgi:hypothetical protein